MFENFLCTIVCMCVIKWHCTIITVFSIYFNYRLWPMTKIVTLCCQKWNRFYNQLLSIGILWPKRLILIFNLKSHSFWWSSKCPTTLSIPKKRKRRFYHELCKIVLCINCWRQWLVSWILNIWTLNTGQKSSITNFNLYKIIMIYWTQYDLTVTAISIDANKTNTTSTKTNHH